MSRLRLSRRTRWPQAPSAWSRTLARARACREPIDLTVSGPTEAGLLHDPSVFAPLAHPDVARYRVASLGLPEARTAVAQYYGARGIEVDPEQVWICASTSEAYHQLFTLLADPGDVVAAPRPGYPLIEHVADIAGLHTVGYATGYTDRWELDPSGLATTVSARTRAVVVVSPNNPTGHVLSPAERALVTGLERPVIVDEVFADYPLDGEASAHLPSRFADVTFRISGLSKVAALPQLKLAWIVVEADHADRREILARAETIADTFLSTQTAVQSDLAHFLAASVPMQRRIRARLKANLADLDRQVRGRPLDRLHVDAGWTALLRLPHFAGWDDARWARYLLETANVVVHPGFMFDLPDPPPRIAVSLLTDEPAFQSGIAALVRAVEVASAAP